MKSLLICIISLFLFSCNQSRHGTMISKEIRNVNELKLSKNEIDEILTENQLISSDSVVFFYNKKETFSDLLRIVKKHNPMKKSVFAVDHGTGEWESIYQQNDSIKFIPVFSDNEGESEMFTKWRILSDSTLEYITTLKPEFYIKIAFERIRDIVKYDDKEYIIGERVEGDEADVFLTFWVARYNGFDEFEKIAEYNSWYNENTNPISFEYRLNGGNISIVLNTDSIIDQNLNKRVRIHSKTVKTIELK